LNNSSKWVNHDQTISTRILKEDMYSTLRVLGQMNKIALFDNENIKRSLRSMTTEYKNDRLRIFGNYSHIAEGLIRATWVFEKKPLKPFII